MSNVMYKCFFCNFVSDNYSVISEHLESNHNVPEEPQCQTLKNIQIQPEDSSVDESLKPLPNNTEQESDTEFQKNDFIRWSPQDTLLLIRLVEANYDKFNSQLKKNVWRSISNELSKTTGKKFDGSQCDSKWKSLKLMYKKILDHNMKHTGNDRKDWEYFEAIHTFLFKKPEINPAATCSSSSGLKITENTELKENKRPTDVDTFESTFKRKRTQVSSGNSTAEKRHQERMVRQDQFLGLFKELVEAIRKDKND
ncbi:uncharacterized protein LOC108905761 [Anoplophora glabripennis]|uniref:uncharacterized protein LOC108905761 n=1 Tax=Anoplophora glabripennis TaxID=217634 RepID=UPI0008746299|nr:uncharacterized protein LOC108905761 [Anoplophora glabripennis]XP_023311535.1 uncharacterized protein LOC108905761 [Anoplophora glabripennis]